MQSVIQLISQSKESHSFRYQPTGIFKVANKIAMTNARLTVCYDFQKLCIVKR